MLTRTDIGTLKDINTVLSWTWYQSLSTCSSTVTFLDYSASPMDHYLDFPLPTSTYLKYLDLPLPTSTYLYLPLLTSTYHYLPIPTSTYLYHYLPLHTSNYLYLPLLTYFHDFRFFTSGKIPEKISHKILRKIRHKFLLISPTSHFITFYYHSASSFRWGVDTLPGIAHADRLVDYKLE